MTMPSPLAAELDVACKLARAAGAAILGHYVRGVAVEYKTPHDPVTEADREANRIIVAGLRHAFPADAILAEESPAEVLAAGQRRLWCVDPLDGTREFLDHNGEFAVMIGLAIDGEARLGVVYQPTEDVLWGGSIGGEAFREVRGGARELIRVTGCVKPEETRIVTSRSHRSKSVDVLATTLGARHVEPLGSVGLKAARIASGEAELYLSMSNRTQEWDACAPEAILRAAGGIMTDVTGEPLRYAKPEPNTPLGLLASNGTLHPLALPIARNLAKQHGLA